MTRLQSGGEDTPVFACWNGYRANSENYRSGTRTHNSGGQVRTKWRMPLVLTLPKRVKLEQPPQAVTTRVFSAASNRTKSMSGR